MEAATYQKNEKLISALCYFPFFSVIVCAFALVKKPGSSLVLYHIRAALSLFALWFIGLFVLAIVPVFGGFTYLVFLAGNIYGAYLAISGRTSYIPVATWFGKFIPLEKIYTILVGKPYPGVRSSVQADLSQPIVPAQQAVQQPEPSSSPTPEPTQSVEQNNQSSNIQK